MNRQPGRTPLVWHPLLVGLIPLLSAYQGNATEVHWHELLLPVALTVGLSLAAWVLLARAWKESRKAALAVSAVSLAFFNFGPAADGLAALTGGGRGWVVPLRSLVVLLVGAALIAAVLRLVFRRPKLLPPLTALLNAFSAVTVAVLVVPVALEVGWLRADERVTAAGAAVAPRPGEGNEPGAGVVLPTAAQPARLPDIYYIVLDTYGRGDVLRDLYGCDNRDFLDGLRRRGFFVADRSTSNYCQTPLSLAASLNGRYHTDLAGTDARLGVLVGAIHDSTVLKTLKAHGYRLVTFRTDFGFTDMPGADVYLAPARMAQAGNEFQSLLLERTPLRLYDEGRYSFAGEEKGPPDQYSDSRRLVRYVFDHLGKVAREKSPKFVFAHVLCPHPPFVFGENGEDVSPHQVPYLMTDGSYYQAHYGGVAGYVPGYRAQALYLSKLVGRAIDDILKNSPEPPIIIVQGDHGPGSRWNCESSEPGQSDLKERLGILNAYYLPDGGDKGLYDDITPVNTFRLVLTHYFGADLDPLPDQSYFSSVVKPFQFVDVTAQVRSAPKSAPE